MVVVSYFTPVLSSVIVAILLGVSLVVVLAGCGIGVRRLVGLLSGDQQLNKPQKIITHAIK